MQNYTWDQVLGLASLCGWTIYSNQAGDRLAEFKPDGWTMEMTPDGFVHVECYDIPSVQFPPMTRDMAASWLLRHWGLK